ncbi:hypothetical protein HYE66_02755 [Aggregatibacter actinomycetemcomitans]|nr:hypothetical protein [Aggregatibacter actinomycetemcomitans]
MLKKILNLVLSILILLLITQQNCALGNANYSKEEIIERENLPISNFFSLYARKFKLENSSTVKPINNISKILFYELIDMQTKNSFAIDIERKKMQVFPDSSHLQGGKEFDTTLSDQDIKTLYGLLEKSNIANWETNYDNASPGLKASGNGYIWNLSLQYNDGTAWYYSGETSPGNPLLPEGYDILVKGLNELADSKKK